MQDIQRIAKLSQSIEGPVESLRRIRQVPRIYLYSKLYIDRAMTGTNDNRPDFKSMIKESNRKEWDYVIVYKFDRFFVTNTETAMHKKRLKTTALKWYRLPSLFPTPPKALYLKVCLKAMPILFSRTFSKDTAW